MIGSVIGSARLRLGMGMGLLGSVAAISIAFAVARAENKPPPPAPPADADSATAPTEESPTGTPAPTVKIVFKIIPPGNATVMWGKKRLGLIKPKAPLIIQRPRDSGPLDVIVRSAGYVPVHTRAYTFTNSTVAVKITPLDQKNTLYGYREEIPPDVDGGVPRPTGPDGGLPP